MSSAYMFDSILSVDLTIYFKYKSAELISSIEWKEDRMGKRFDEETYFYHPLTNSKCEWLSQCFSGWTDAEPYQKEWEKLCEFLDKQEYQKETIWENIRSQIQLEEDVIEYTAEVEVEFDDDGNYKISFFNEEEIKGVFEDEVIL